MRTLALTLVLLVAAPVAAAAEGAPWTGGAGIVTEIEATAGAFASSVAGRPVAVVCNAPEDWASLAEQARFDASQVWGYVPFFSDTPGDYTNLSSAACTYLQAFARAADKRSVTVRCRTGTRIVFTASKQRRATPVYGECPDYGLVLGAVATLAHESVHLRGFRDEGVTECYAVQLVAGAARWLGGGDTLARRMATDYWQRSYRVQPAGSEYFRADCVDGSALDLSPASQSWPAGAGALVLPTP
jgi:hypothetical protein